MRAKEFLLEYDRQATAKNYLPRLLQKCFGDIHESPKFFAEIISGLGMRMRNKDFAERINGDPDLQLQVMNFILGRIEAADPSPKKKFVPVMTRWYVEREFLYLEDLGRVIAALRTYMKFKNRFNGINLKTISFEEFEEIMDETLTQPSNSQEDKATEQGFYDRQEASLIHDDNEIKIVNPHTEAASCFFGRNTKWCTAAREDNQFDHYDEMGSIFIILFKKENRRWQWHFEQEEFMDERDVPLSPQQVRESKPAQIIAHIMIWAAEGGCDQLLDYIPHDKITREFVENMVSSHPGNIRWVCDNINDLQINATREYIDELIEIAADGGCAIGDIPAELQNPMICLRTLVRGRYLHVSDFKQIADPLVRNKIIMIFATRNESISEHVFSEKNGRYESAPISKEAWMLALAHFPDTVIKNIPHYPDEQKMEAWRAIHDGLQFDIVKEIYKTAMAGGLAADEMRAMLRNRYGVPHPFDDLLEWAEGNLNQYIAKPLQKG
jgi:hypothetical protein